MKKLRLIDSKTEALALAYRNNGNLVHLSKTSKLGTLSWSLQALNTCPASVNLETGELVDACKGCYATAGQYNYSTVKAPREYNRWAWKQEDFVEQFVNALQGVSHFRWFDSGDMYSIELASKMWNIMERTPNTKHWLPTRMHKFKKFHSVLNAMNELENVCVRLSSDSIMGEHVEKPITVHTENNSTIIPSDYVAGFEKDGAFICKAPEQGGKCLKCRACYDKDIKTIAYIGHGRVMKINQSKKIHLTEVK